jgi:hypothetical protein
MPLANLAVGYGVYKGVKGLMSRLKTAKPKKKKKTKAVSIGHGQRSLQKIYGKYKG